MRDAVLGLAFDILGIALGYQFGRKTIVVHLCPEAASTQAVAVP